MEKEKIDFKESFFRLDEGTWSNIWLIVIITLVVGLLIFMSNTAITKHKRGERPGRFLMFVMYFAGGMKNMIDENCGKRFRFLGPYLMFLMVFFLVSVSLGFFGLPVSMTTLSVPLTLAMVMFVLNWTFAIRDYKVKFFAKFINPLNLIGELSPIVSLSFRIFGNMVAGGIILGLINHALNGLQDTLIPDTIQFNAFGAVVVAPLRMYFDVFAGLIQAYIFTLLTIIYIGLAVKPEDELKEEKMTVESVPNNNLAKA